jgi:hypothetical protein
VVVKFEDLFSAFEFVSAGHPMEHQAYLCVETGTIHYHSEIVGDDEPAPDDLDDAEKYIPIPHKNDLDLGKRLALRFADQYLVDADDDVHEIFARKGAYARFKSVLEQRGLLQQWYEFEERSKKEALLLWCEETQIKAHG